MKVTYLAHHGILGQKWGIRRYQNENGSLTKEGKRRYREEKYNQYYDDDINDGFFAKMNAKSKARTATMLANSYSKYDVKLDKKKAKYEQGIAEAKLIGDNDTAKKLSKKWIKANYSQLYAKDFVKNIDKRTEEYMHDTELWSIGTLIAGPIGGGVVGIGTQAYRNYKDKDLKESLKKQSRADYEKKFKN